MMTGCRAWRSGWFRSLFARSASRPLRCLTDRLCVRCVVLLPLHKGLHIRWRNKQNFMTQAGKLAAPIMRRTAGSHRNSAPRLSCKELQDSSPAQSLSKHDRAGGIRSVHLKHHFGQIQSNRANLAYGRLRLGDLNARPWHIDAVAGASTPSVLCQAGPLSSPNSGIILPSIVNRRRFNQQRTCSSHQIALQEMVEDRRRLNYGGAIRALARCERMALEPQQAGCIGRIDACLAPPHRFIAVSVNLAMVSTA